MTNVIFNHAGDYFFTPDNLVVNPFSYYCMENGADKLALPAIEYEKIIKKHYPRLWNDKAFHELKEGETISFGMSSTLSYHDRSYHINGAKVPEPDFEGLVWYNGGFLTFKKNDLIFFKRVIKTHGRDYAYLDTDKI